FVPPCASRVAIGEPRVGSRELRVLLDRLFEKFCGRTEVRWKFVPLIQSTKVEEVRIRGRPWLRRRGWCSDQLRSDLLRDIARDIVLQREDISDLPLIVIRPEMTISSGIDELGRHAHALAIASDRSFHDCLHAELACNLRERKAACFELI